MMRIVVDCSYLRELNRSGTQNYLYYLLKSLSLADNVNEYHLCFDHKISDSFIKEITNENPKFHCHYLKKYLSWTQVSLAVFLVGKGFDILVSPWQTMPIVHSFGLKIVAVIHGLEYDFGRGGPTLYTCLFSNKIIAVSNFTKTEIVRRCKVNPRKIEVLYEGVDTGKFYKRSEEEIQKVKGGISRKVRPSAKSDLQGDYVLFVGKVVERKNLPRMIEAFSVVIRDNEACRNLSFVIGGSISKFMSERLYDLCVKFGVANRVLFIGYVKESNLPPLISGSKILFYTSLSEGFGLPVLEAMACGVPVLTSNSGALPEVAGDAALLVNPRDINDMVGGLKKLLTDENLRNTCVAKGYEQIKKFSWERMAEGFLEVLRQI